MNDVKHDELSIYGEYACRAGRVTIDFFLELFAQKIYAEDQPLSEFSKTFARRVGVRQRGKKPRAIS